MKTKLISIIAATLISACIPHIGKAPTTNGTFYQDLNDPKVEVDFPFNVYYFNFSRAAREGMFVLQHRLKSDDPDIEIYINKAINNEQGTSFYLNEMKYLGQALYYEEFEKGNCKILKIKRNGITHIETRITKLIKETSGYDIKISKKTKNYPTREEWVEKYDSLIEEFIGYSKFIISQLN